MLFMKKNFSSDVCVMNNHLFENSKHQEVSAMQLLAGS
jgi:hypothetical protein